MDASFKNSHHRAARKKFLELSLESTRKSYYPQLKKQLESAKENQKRLQLLIDNLPAQVAYVDSKERYVFANRKFAQSFGLKRSWIIGRKMAEILGDKNYRKVKPHIDFALSGKSGSFEFSFDTDETDIKWYEINYVPETDRQGRVSGFYVLTIDLTEKKKEQEEKLRLKDRLRQAQKMEAIGTLSGGIAHDFNNILFPIIGMSELLLEDFPVQSREYESVQMILKAGKRGAALVKQILAFSRQSEHVVVPVQIQQILKEVYKLARATIPTSIEIIPDFQADCGQVMADPIQIHQVAMNLITNAFHAVGSKDGKISVRLKETRIKEGDPDITQLPAGKYAQLSIADNGHGIPAELTNKIFEPYFTTKEQGKGTGLGLAVVYGIISEHKGEIVVKSDVGGGTTFSAYFPVIEKESGRGEKQQSHGLPTGDESILVVDDEEAIAKLETQILNRLGYHATICTDSHEALELFKENPGQFDLVITDMTMPNLTGAQLAKKIMVIRPDIPVVICTGFSEQIDEKKADEIGVKGLLLKPVGLSDLAEKVRRILDGAKKPGN